MQQFIYAITGYTFVKYTVSVYYHIVTLNH